MKRMSDTTESTVENNALGPVDPGAEQDLRGMLALVGEWLTGLDPKRGPHAVKISIPEHIGQALLNAVAERDALDAFLRRAVENLKTNPDGERWLYVCDAFLTDPETAKKLCLRYGLDPDERV